MGPWEVFQAFLALGLSSCGGPLTHLGYFRKAFVERWRWLNAEAYAALVAQTLPGPTSSQVGMAIGYLRGGPWGAFLAWLAFTFPSASSLGLPRRPWRFSGPPWAGPSSDSMEGMDVLEKAVAGERLSEAEVLSLFDLPLPELAAAAHEVRLKKTDPEVVTFLIDRNINYTNVCTVACAFCAFYRTKRQKDAYTLSYEEIARKVEELYQVGGRRILMQGGVNPELPLEWYLDLLRYLKGRFPDLRIDAFSPEEILGLERLTGLRAEAILEKLKEAGLDGLPGAGAEILVDEVRLKAAPARIRTADWYRIVDAAQALGLYTLATMVIGFGEGPKERTAHLLGLRAQQDRALERYENGFAAFALWTLQVEHTRLKGKAPGATAHEYLRTLAIARLALDNFVHFQASWPTLGFKVAQAALYYGADDFGSTMLEENVVSAAGGHGRTHATVRQIVRHIVDAGFKPAERDPLYRILRYPDAEAILSEPEPVELPLA